MDRKPASAKSKYENMFDRQLVKTFAVKTKPLPAFLNVDLDVVSSRSLECLAKQLGNGAMVLHSGPIGRRHLLRVESSRSRRTPDSAVRDLCRAIEALPSEVRRVWDDAEKKEFNVGFELKTDLREVQVPLKPETVKRIAGLGATVAFTCYREDDCGSQSQGTAP